MGDVAVGQVLVERQGIDPAGDVGLGQGQQRLQLAGEDEPRAVVAVDQGLLPQPVAGQDERAAGASQIARANIPRSRANIPVPSSS